MTIDQYGPFGEPGLVSAGRNQGRMRYTGQMALPELVPASGPSQPLLSYKARIYAPRLGRFLQTDPAGTADDPNLYAYVGNDPVNATDPTGLAAESVRKWWNTPVKGTRTYIPSEIEMARPEYAYGSNDIGTLSNRPMTRGEITLGIAEIIGTVAPALKAARGARAAEDAFSHGYIYADRVRVRGAQDPVSHNFPYSYDDAILKTTPIPKANGYNIYRAPGTMGEKSGAFEIGVTKDGVIDHRFFRPNK